MAIVTKESMKPILFVTIPWSDHGAGGAERVMVRVLNELTDDFEIHVAAIARSKTARPQDFFAKEITVHLLIASRSRYAFVDLVKLFRQLKPDVILANVMHVACLSILANTFVSKRCPVISVHHGMLCNRRIDRVEEFVVARWSKKLITVSQGLKDALMESSHVSTDRVEVILNSVDVDRIQELSCEPIDPKEIIWDTKKKTIIFVGRFEEAKSLDVLIKSVRILIHDLEQDVNVLLVGDGEERSRCEQLICDLDLSTNIFFLGWKTNPYKFIAASDTLVLTSHREGFGMVLLEALACGVPVVSTDCLSGPSEILDAGKFGALVPVGDVRAIANALMQTLNRPVDRERLIACAREIGGGQVGAYKKNLLNFASSRAEREIFGRSRGKISPVGRNEASGEKIKIIYLITGLNVGGAEIFLRDLVCSLDRKKFDPIVVSMIPIGIIGKQLIDQGIDVRSLSVYGKYDPRRALDLFRLLKQERPEILHTVLFHANLLGRIIGRAAGVSIIVSTIQNEYFGGWMRERLLAWTDGLCDMTTVVSKRVYDRMTRLGIVRSSVCKVIHNGIRVDAFFSLLHLERSERSSGEVAGRFLPLVEMKRGEEDRIHLLAIGRLVEQKGFFVLLDVIANLKKMFPTILLVIVGEGELRSAIEKRIDELELRDQVKLVGERTDTQTFFQKADVFVLSSLFEGFGNVVLEAMACGVPVVATNTGGVPEMIAEGKSGFIVPSNDSSALARAIERTLHLSSEEKKNMIESARRTVEEKFSIQKIAEEYLNLYETFIRHLES